MTESNKVKVLFLTPSLSPSGFGRQLVELVKGLDKEDFEPVVCVFGGEIHFKEILNDRKLKVIRIERNGIRRLFFPFKLLAAVRRENPRILHGFQHGGNKWARLAGLILGMPNVITSVRNTRIRRKWLIIERLLHSLGRTIIVNSEAIRFELSRGASIPEGKIRVIPNGVDTDRFYVPDAGEVRAARDSLGLREDALVIAQVGGLSRQKNPEALLEAIRMIRERGELPSEINVIFVGGSSNPAKERDFRKRLEREPFRDICRVLSPIDRIERIYHAMDLLVLPSRWEGLPNVMLEAMACGRAVITSEAANNARVIDNGVNGWEFRTGDSAALADAIVTGIHDRGMRNAMGRAGRRRVSSQFRAEGMVDRTDKLYREILEMKERELQPCPEVYSEDTRAVR